MGRVYGNIHEEAALALKDKLGLLAFVETGTFHGETVLWAKDRFQQVYSMDIWKDMILSVGEKIKAANVTLIHGDSRKELPAICSRLSGTPTLFWLDAHYSGITGTYDPQGCSLGSEIKAINNHFLGVHAIMVDDYAVIVEQHQDEYFPLLRENRNGGRRQIAVFDDIVVACSAMPEQYKQHIIKDK